MNLFQINIVFLVSSTTTSASKTSTTIIGYFIINIPYKTFIVSTKFG
jgi:hypothetical protein